MTQCSRYMFNSITPLLYLSYRLDETQQQTFYSILMKGELCSKSCIILPRKYQKSNKNFCFWNQLITQNKHDIVGDAKGISIFQIKSFPKHKSKSFKSKFYLPSNSALNLKKLQRTKNRKN